jgi:hypothetical protein
MQKSLGTLGSVTAVVLSGATAQAHIDLLEPEARAHGTAARGDTQIDENSNLKSGPCGQVTTGRTARVATYAPGETITVRVREENAHVSYLRVSIDLDGESFPLRSEVPPAPETQEEALAAELALGGDGLLAVVREDNDTAGFVHEIEVTLPDATCDGCTLQVLQFMYDDPAAPYYFQCADLVLEAPSSEPDAGARAGDASDTSSSGAGGPGTRGAAPEAPRSAGSGDDGAASSSAAGATGSSTGAAPPPSAAPVTAQGPAATDGGAGSSSGCSLGRGTSGRSALAFALAGVALGLGSRLRRRWRKVRRPRAR